MKCYSLLRTIATPENNSEGATKVSKYVRMVLLGAPGSNRFETGEAIAKRFQVTHISLRGELKSHVSKNTEMGVLLRKLLVGSNTLSESTMLKFIIEEIDKRKTKSWLLNQGALNESIAIKLWEHTTFDLAITIHYPSYMLVKQLRKKYYHEGDMEGDNLKLQRIDYLLRHYREALDHVSAFYKSKGILVSYSGTDFNVILKTVLKDINERFPELRRKK